MPVLLGVLSAAGGAQTTDTSAMAGQAGAPITDPAANTTVPMTDDVDDDADFPWGLLGLLGLAGLLGRKRDDKTVYVDPTTPSSTTRPRNP